MKGLAQGDSIGGFDSCPKMTLSYGVQVSRMEGGLTPLGSAGQTYQKVGGIIPCEIAPVTDTILMAQMGQTDMLTHVLHFQINADVQKLDAVEIVYTPSGMGEIGQSYIILELTQPATDLAYIRCMAYRGKLPAK
jgi:hypothetical protein